MTPRISICLAVRPQGWPAAQALYRRLAEQTRMPDWEMITVINGNDAPSSASGEETDPRHRVFTTPQAGKSHALNQAMRVARGELILFTDDDVVPHAGWLDAYAQALHDHPEACIFGGPVRAIGAVPGWITRSRNLQTILLSAHELPAGTAAYPPGQYPIGPNMAVRRDIAQQHDAAWPTWLGPGTRLPVGDELGFLSQISAAAARDRRYLADAIVEHRCQPAHLHTLGAMRRAHLGGLAAGRLAPLVRARSGSASTSQTTRPRAPASLRELLCVLSRALGVAWGRFSPYTEETIPITPGSARNR